MPAPGKTGRSQIVAACRALLAEGGPDAVTMQAVAARVGVRAPSLYKHVRDRRALLEAAVAAVVADLTERVEALADHADPGASIAAQMTALRTFAHAHPNEFPLVFGAVPGVPSPERAGIERSLAPLLAATTALLGENHALHAARLVVAWANGFLTMELAGALRLGGDLDEAWTWGLHRVVAALGEAEPERL